MRKQKTKEDENSGTEAEFEAIKPRVHPQNGFLLRQQFFK